MNTMDQNVVSAIIDLPAGNAGANVKLSNDKQLFIPRWNIDKWIKYGQNLIDLLKKMESLGLFTVREESDIEPHQALEQLEQLVCVFLPAALDIISGTLDVPSQSDLLINLPLVDVIEIIVTIINQEFGGNSTIN